MNKTIERQAQLHVELEEKRHELAVLQHEYVLAQNQSQLERAVRAEDREVLTRICKLRELDLALLKSDYECAKKLIAEVRY